MAEDKSSIISTQNKPVDDVDSCTNKQVGIESLLLDTDDRLAVSHLAEQEVRVVGVGKSKNYGTLIGIFLFCIVVAGAGFYYLPQLLTLAVPPDQPSLFSSPKVPVPVRSITSVVDMPDVDNQISETDMVLKDEKIVAPTPSLPKTPVVTEPLLFTVVVGPFINSDNLNLAISSLRELGFQSQKVSGRGQVTMVRLLEGIYSRAEALIHLTALKKVANSAFILPDGDKLAVYAGSFRQEKRARSLQVSLAQEKIDVALITSEVVMAGTMLQVLQADQQTAQEIVEHISKLGLSVQMKKNK